jgi:hypothetical protein
MCRYRHENEGRRLHEQLRCYQHPVHIGCGKPRSSPLGLPPARCRHSIHGFSIPNHSGDCEGVLADCARCDEILGEKGSQSLPHAISTRHEMCFRELTASYDVLDAYHGGYPHKTQSLSTVFCARKPVLRFPLNVITTSPPRDSFFSATSLTTSMHLVSCRPRVLSRRPVRRSQSMRQGCLDRLLVDDG